MGLDKIQKIDEQIALIKERTELLREENAKRAEYIERWNAQHEIRNLMGKFAFYYSAGKFVEAGEMFSATDQVYLQQSDIGIFEGKDAVKAYFKQLQDDVLPGSFRIMLLSSEIVEVAKDGKSAQGTWINNGMAAIKNPEDPAVPASDMWINDKIAAEFILENGKWVILRLNINEEMRANYHRSWGDYAEKPEYPEFDKFAEPTRPATRHKPFRADRKSQKNLVTPEPYNTYSDLVDHF